MDLRRLRQAGLMAYCANDLTTAERHFRHCLELVPDDGEALHHLGATLAAAGRGEEALRHLALSVAAVPDNAPFWFNLGLISRINHREEAAFGHLAAALRLQPGFPEAHFQTGQILQTRGDHVGANRHLSAAALDAGLRAQCDELVTYNQVFHTGERAHEAPSRLPDPPLVSVVIPCVNYGRFVVEAVESCLNQTYPAVEVVVVDGGSDDEHTRAIVTGLRHPRVRTVCRSPRRRVGDNRNFGLGLARGALVCCLDADDMLAPDYIDKAVFVLTRLGYDLVGAGVEAFGTVETRRNFIRHPGTADLLRSNQFAMGTMFRRDAWAAAGGFHDLEGDAAFHEDWNFWLRLVAMGARAFNINWEYLIRCRQHARTAQNGQARMSERRTLLPLDRQIALFRALNADVLPAS